MQKQVPGLSIVLVMTASMFMGLADLTAAGNAGAEPIQSVLSAPPAQLNEDMALINLRANMPGATAEDICVASVTFTIEYQEGKNE